MRLCYLFYFCDVIVAGSRFLGSGRVGCVGRSNGVVLCCGVVLLGERVIV